MSTETRSHQSAETEHVDELALGGAAAAVSAAVMVLLGVFGTVGIYEGAIEMMEQWHLVFEPTVIGTLSGMIEGAVISFVIAYAFGWLYNAFCPPRLTST